MNGKKIVRRRVLLLVVIVFQILSAFFWGGKKEGFHIDEIFTHTLANYTDGFICRTEGARNEWKSGDFYKDVVEINRDETFNYRMVYRNQEIDVHPPLYYYIIHTVSSFFCDYSKWIGIGINIFLAIMTSVALFYISNKMLDDDIMAGVSTFTWALSIGAMTSVVFIRMYMLLTFITVVTAGIHIKAFEEIRKSKIISFNNLGIIFLCTVVGLLTQYYYLIFCFFLCGLFFLWLVINKEWEPLIKYCLIQLCAIIVCVAYFPAMINHIFHEYRGEQAFNAFVNTKGFFDTVQNVVSIIGGQLFNGWSREILGILILLNIYICLKHMKGINLHKTFSNVKLDNSSYVLGWLLTTVIGYVVIVAKVAPYQTDRYYMCIYPFVVLVMIKFVKLILEKAIKEKSRIVVIILFCTIVALSYIKQEVRYLYEDNQERMNVLNNYKGSVAIVINGRYDSAPDRWLFEYSNYSDVFICGENGDLTGLREACSTKNLSKGFLLYVHEIQEQEKQLFEKIGEYMNIKSYNLVTDIGCRVFYCELK